MKKGDVVIVGLVAITVVTSLLFSVAFATKGNRVVIKHNKKVIYNQSIDINDTVDTGTNTIVIKDGVIYMSDSDCKNQICVNTGKISKKGESIVCLPNKIIVEIK